MKFTWSELRLGRSYFAAATPVGLTQALALMIKLKSPRIVFSGICVLAITVVALAYGMPYFQENTCRKLAAEYLKHNPVSGASYFASGQIYAKASDIKIRIIGPFANEARYSVPNLMHNTIYTHKCSVSLFLTSLSAREKHKTI